MLVGFDSATFCVNNLSFLKEEKLVLKVPFRKNLPIRKNFLKKKTLLKSTVKVFIFSKKAMEID